MMNIKLNRLGLLELERELRRLVIGCEDGVTLGQLDAWQSAIIKNYSDNLGYVCVCPAVRSTTGKAEIISISNEGVDYDE